MKSVKCFYCAGHAVEKCEEYVGDGKKCKRPLCSRHANKEKGHTTCLGHAPHPDVTRPWEVACA